MSEPVPSVSADDAAQVGRCMRRLRDRAGLSVAQVSSRAKLRPEQYAGMEAGRADEWQTIGILELYRLSLALQCHVSELFLDTDDDGAGPARRPPGPEGTAGVR